MEKIFKLNREVVNELVYHIENPCSVEVNGKTENIRNFYLKIAQNLLPTLVNDCSKEFLQEVIDNYN